MTQILGGTIKAQKEIWLVQLFECQNETQVQFWPKAFFFKVERQTFLYTDYIFKSINLVLSHCYSYSNYCRLLTRRPHPQLCSSSMHPRAGGGGATCFLLLLAWRGSLDQRRSDCRKWRHMTLQLLLWLQRVQLTHSGIVWKTHHSWFWVTFGAGCGKLLEESLKDSIGSVEGDHSRVWNRLPLLSVGVLRLMGQRFWHQPVPSWRRKCPIVLDRLNAASTGPSVAVHRASPWRRSSARRGSACTRRFFSWSASGCPGSSSSRLWPSPVGDASEPSVTEVQKDITSPLSSFTLYLARQQHS